MVQSLPARLVDTVAAQNDAFESDVLAYVIGITGGVLLTHTSFSAVALI